MTNREAAKILEQQKNEYLDKYIDYGGVTQAYQMAINLLNKQDKPCPWCGNSASLRIQDLGGPRGT